MASTPCLAITAGPAVTIWECLTEAETFTFYPQGDIPVSDVAWNHNAQGIDCPFFPEEKAMTFVASLC